jgi:alkylated DNA repair dioxygenase AlkB
VVSGLKFVEDFITREEEELIVSKLPVSPKKSRKSGRSSIWRYGAKVYGNKVVSANLPEYLNFLLDRLVEHKYLKSRPDHITINEYQKGDSISAHIDNEQSGPIISIVSLLSDANMVLTKTPDKTNILIPSKSLLQLSGESRWDWKHAILPVPNLRYSIVFRDSKLNS